MRSRMMSRLIGATVTTVVAAGTVVVPVATADTITPTVQNGHLTDWWAGYNAAEYEVDSAAINGYPTDGIGSFLYVTDAGAQFAVWCLQPDVGHSTTANYQPVANSISSPQLDVITFLHGDTTDDATATAVQSAIWHFANGTRSGATPGLLVWANSAAGFSPITPSTPDSWSSLPQFDSTTFPVGLQLRDAVTGTINLDGAEALTEQLWAEANLLQGPWTINAPTQGAGTYSTRITSAWNAPVPGRTVTFTLPGGGQQTAVTDANGVATIAAGPVSGTVTVSAAAPGTHTEFAAQGAQQLVGAGTPTTITRDAPFQENPALTSTASDAGDGDQVVVEGGTVSDSVPITKLTVGHSYTLHGQLFDIDANALVGSETTETFTAANTDETHTLSLPVPAGSAGHRLVWFLVLDDNSTAAPGIAVARDTADLAETVLVPPSISVTTDAGPSVTVPRGQSIDLADTVRLAGLAGAFRSTPAETASGTAALYGPFPTLADAVCTVDHLVGSVPVAFAADGTTTTGTVTVTPSSWQSVYTWQVALTTTQGRTVTHACGLPSETPAVTSDVTAEVHLRKTISADGGPEYNAQKGTTPGYAPGVAPTVPAAGSHDDQAADAGDQVPVYPAGAVVTFRYSVWLDPSSTGWAAWSAGTTGVVVDDNGTPTDGRDDWTPLYVSGDSNNDGILQPAEIWVYEAKNKITAKAGDNYRNYSSIPPGRVVDGADTTRDTGLSTQPRSDPAGYVVPQIGTTAISQADQTHLVGPAGGTIVDTVAYTNLVPGAAVTVSGEAQVRQADGSVVPSGIVGSTTFTPTAASASVDVMFNVPASSTPGVYVFFETLVNPVDDTTLAVHHDPTDADQTIRKRAAITVSTRACKSELEVPDGSTVAVQCDVITVGGDGPSVGFPGDVVTGTVTAYPVVNGLRQCATPGPSTAWSATIGTSGMVVVSTTDLNVPVGDWEFIETAATADGRTWSRDCATAPRDPAESFKVVPSKLVPGKYLPGTGADSASLLGWAAGLVASGVAGLVVVGFGRRRRRVV